jgi:hypothetical protein
MPYQAAGSLSVDDTYAVAAYILNLNGILPSDGKFDKKTLPAIKMPNRDGFVPDAEFREIAKPNIEGERRTGRATAIAELT